MSDALFSNYFEEDLLLLARRLYQYSEHKRKRYRPDVAYRLSNLSVCRSVCVCVQKVQCGKTADWIRMPLAMVSGVGRGMGVLDGAVIVQGEGAVLGVNLGHSIITQWNLCCIVVRE